MKLIVIEPDIVIGQDVLACLEDQLSPSSVLLRASLEQSSAEISELQAGDLLVVSTTLGDLKASGILSEMPTSPYSLLILNTDEAAKPRPEDPWHRIPKPFSARMLIQGAHAALEKRSSLARQA